MSDGVLMVALLTITGVLALNMFLTLRLARRATQRPGASTAEASPGRRLPRLDARRLDGDVIDWADLTATPFVLTFLSAHCPACREALRRLKTLAAAARAAGVPIHIVAMEEGGELDRLLEGAGLGGNRLMLDAASRRRLNPANAALYYMFVRQGGVLEAVGYVGDADWEAFGRQLTETRGSAFGVDNS